MIQRFRTDLFFKIYLFMFEREKEREQVCMSQGRAEGEGETESQTDCLLSIEPNKGLNLRTQSHDWAEIKSLILTNWATQMAQSRFKYRDLKIHILSAAYDVPNIPSRDIWALSLASLGAQVFSAIKKKQ